MVSFKRFLHIILIIAVVGGIFLIYTINESRPESVQTLSLTDMEREFTEISPVNESEKPRVWLLGDPEDVRCGDVYGNVRQLCEDLHLTMAGEDNFNISQVEEGIWLFFVMRSSAAMWT